MRGLNIKYDLCRVLNNSDTIDMVLVEDEECSLPSLNEEIGNSIKEAISIINRYLEKTNGYCRARIEDIDSKLCGVNYDETKKSIRFQNIIGPLFYRKLRIWFVPKIFKGTEFSTKELVRNTMLLLYHLNKYIMGYSKRISKTILKRGDPIHFLFDLYIDDLNSELKRGIYREYAKFTTESSYIRGKLIVPDLVRKYPHGFQKPISQQWLLSVNNPLNKVFYVATLRALGNVDSKTTKTKAFEILGLLREAEEEEYYINKIVPLVKFNRLNERFRELFYLANLILGYLTVPGRNALIFIQNTPDLFEKYIFEILKRKLMEFNIWYQHKISSIICCADDHKGSKVSIPDIVVKTSNGFIPIDVKYKIVKTCDDISAQDIYQIAFYARILNSIKAILVYPSINESKLIHIETRKVESPTIKKTSFEKDLNIYIVYYNFSSVIKEGRVDYRFVENIKEVLKS